MHEIAHRKSPPGTPKHAPTRRFFFLEKNENNNNNNDAGVQLTHAVFLVFRGDPHVYARRIDVSGGSSSKTQAFDAG